MSTLLGPGVYIEEIAQSQYAIAPVPTSIGAFVGWADQGPVTEATLVGSIGDFDRIFGGPDKRSLLGYSVHQFFANGGTECYVVRLVWPAVTNLVPVGSPSPALTARATNVGYPMVTITATYQGVMGSVTLGVGTPVLTSMRIVPKLTGSASLPPMPIQSTMDLVGVPTYSDGVTTTPPAGVSWLSTNPLCATVDANTGTVTALTPGTTVIRASVITPTGVISAEAPLEVKAVFTQLTVSVSVPAPGSATPDNVPSGQSVSMMAAAQFTDATLDATDLVQWSSPSPEVSFTGTGVATLKGAQGTAVQITATLPWTYTIPAGQPSPSGSLNLTIDFAAILSMTIFPANFVLTQGDSVALEVWGTTSEQSSAMQLAAPYQWNWTSSDTSVATIAAGSNTVDASAGPPAGKTTITVISTAPVTSYTQSTGLTVTLAHLQSIIVSSTSMNVIAGTTAQLTATGVYDDGTHADLTSAVTWNPGAGASVLPGGKLTALDANNSPASITAQFATKNLTITSAPISITISPPQLVSVLVTPDPSNTTATLLPGQPFKLIATAAFSNATTQNVTPTATWAASLPTTGAVALGVVTVQDPGVPLTLYAANPGAWGNSLSVSITRQPAPNASRFNLNVMLPDAQGRPKTIESFTNLSTSPLDPNYVVHVIDNASNYVSFIDPDSGSNTPFAPTGTPATTASGAPVTLSGGDDGSVLTPTDGNFETVLLDDPNGAYLLRNVDIFNLLCVPGESDASTVTTLQGFCQQERAFMIVDSPAEISLQKIKDQGPVGTSSGAFMSVSGANAGNSAYYFPWIYAPDPLSRQTTNLYPPCGFVAGIYAATDVARGFWKAPAGIEATIAGNRGLQYVMNDLDNGVLNPKAVNCLRDFNVYGQVIWGARTLAGDDALASDSKYVPVRRLALFIEQSLYRGLKWVLFEPNDFRLWSKIRLSVDPFMQGLFRDQALAGTTADESYMVVCDDSTNPQSNIDLGIVTVIVGFAPVKPAEFVFVQIQQMTIDAQ